MVQTERPGSELVWQQVHWPAPFQHEHALGLLGRLSSDTSRQPVVWETRSIEGKISHLIGTSAQQSANIASVLESLVSGAAISPMAERRAQVAQTARLRVKGQQLHLATENAPQGARTLLGALSAAQFRGELAVIQIVLGRGRRPQLVTPRPADPTQSWFDLLTRGSRPAPTTMARRIEGKASEPGFIATIRVGASAGTEARRIAIMSGILAALRTLQSPGTQLDFVKDRPSALDAATIPNCAPLHLSVSEVMSLAGWPLDADDLPGMPAAHPKALRLRATDVETKRVFATTSAPGTPKPLGISTEDSLFHTVLLGPTGAGKSTAMLNLIVSDLKVNRGMVVIDPKADLIHDVLERIAPSRLDDVVVLDPSKDAPVGLNPLHVPGTSPELIADGILTIFRDLFPSVFGPRTSDVLHASLLTLARREGATLAWLPRLLTDAQFRAGLVDDLDDPDGLDSFWAQFSNMSERQQAQFIGPVLSRLRQFLLRPSIRRVLDQPSPKFQLEEVFTKKKILLVPLSAGLLGGEASKLMGSLLVSQLWHLTLARAAQPAATRTPVSIFIDEAQEFLHLGDLSDALARSRSMNVAWHAAHQFRDQLTSDVKAAIDANARNKIVFGLGVKDAREMAAMAPELMPEDFMALPKYEVYTNLMRHGQNVGWVSGTTLAAPPGTSDPVEVLARSQRRYGSDQLSGTKASAPKATRPPGATRPDEPIGRRKRAGQ